MRASIGDVSRSTSDLGEFEIETERTSDLHIHPLYQTRNYKEWDACLVKFPSIKAAAPQTCDNCFSSACLPEKAPSHGEFCWVAGWGFMNEGSNLADSLQEVGVNLYNFDYCTEKSVYGSVRIIHFNCNIYNCFFFQKLNMESELCAGTIDEDGDGLIDGGFLLKILNFKQENEIQVFLRQGCMPRRFWRSSRL